MRRKFTEREIGMLFGAATSYAEDPTSYTRAKARYERLKDEFAANYAASHSVAARQVRPQPRTFSGPAPPHGGTFFRHRARRANLTFALRGKSRERHRAAVCGNMNGTSRMGDNVNRFQTTRWSLVLAARTDSAESRDALDTLCRTYRSPVLAYVRGRGYSVDEAEDLAQTFFARFIERAFHAHADPARGRFRAFLLTALKHFLNDANDATRAAKRGGDIHVRSLDSLVGSQDSLGNIQDSETPEREFERAWAHSILQTALDRLRGEASAAGKLELFGHLREFLIERPDDVDYARVASDLNLRRNTVAVAVHRLRHRLRALVCEELAHTAADDDDMEQELEELRHSLGAVIQ